MKFTRIALIACVSSLAVGIAHAQDAAPQETAASVGSGVTGDIIVTARRRAEDISKVPVAVTAFSSQQIETKNITNVTDLTKLTPGLNITGGGSKMNVFVTIRGQSRGVTGNVSPGVLTYFNEIPLPTYGSMIPTYDMDSLQVLKGPQGTLFGRNSIGGAILTYSKAPTHDYSGYVKGEIGQYANRMVEGAVNVPIIPEKVAVRLAGTTGRSGGYTKTYSFSPYTIDPITRVASPPSLIPSTHNADEYDTTSFRASLLIEPVDGIKNVTVYDYTKVRGIASSRFRQFFPSGVNGGSPSLWLLPPASIRGAAAAGRLGSNIAVGQAIAENIIRLAQCGTSYTCDYNLFGQTAQAAGPDISFRNGDPWASVTKIWGVSNTTTIDLADNVRLKNIFGYRTTDSYSNGDIDGTPLTVTDTSSHIRQRIITEELQLSGDLFDGNLKYTLGGFYFKQSPDGLGGTQALEINALFGLSHSTAISYFTDSSKALYGQVDYSLDSILPGLSLTAGYRNTWDTSGGCVMSLVYSPFANQLVMETPTDPIPSEATCASGTLKAGVSNTASSISSAVLPDKKFSKGTYNFGINWQATPDALIYVATRRGYRAGSYNAPLYDTFLSSVQTFAPETLTDYELGTKLRWNSGSMSGSFDFAGFIGKAKGTQLPLATSQLTGAGVACIPQALATSNGVLCTTSGGVAGRQVTVPAATTYSNAGDATISGFEVSATLSPIEGLVLGGSASYVHVKTDRIAVDPALAIVLAANNRSAFIPTKINLRQQPSWTANANLYYEHQRPVLGGRAFFNADLRYRTDYSEGEDVIKGSTTVDARVGVNDIGGTGLDAAVNVTNVFDKLYDYGSVGSSLSAGYRSTLRGAPRTVTLSLRYKWGN